MKEGIRTKKKRKERKEKQRKIDVSFRFSNAGKNNCDSQFIE
jgi:hypothetical protein